ncbi:hypothetical protein EDB81DRAFT_70794 [Dactylonectria macrodidyma]|uniref:Uncharacterized protein n=1 Tax=Dactylonectria macrodidyma TaxID=307937 RepID=A0A9P9EIX3_9HYPO|nr:hypothetical protein EDB81DRAFT_70794 [Dactylonectria macrodidyma]
MSVGAVIGADANPWTICAAGSGAFASRLTSVEGCTIPVRLRELSVQICHRRRNILHTRCLPGALLCVSCIEGKRRFTCFEVSLKFEIGLELLVGFVGFVEHFRVCTILVRTDFQSVNRSIGVVNVIDSRVRSAFLKLSRVVFKLSRVMVFLGLGGVSLGLVFGGILTRNSSIWSSNNRLFAKKAEQVHFLALFDMAPLRYFKHR